MNLNQQKIINLPVYTQSGQHLGKVADFELETLSQTIVKYYVKSASLIKGILAEDLVINKDQVISLSEEKMVVEDALIPEPILKKEAVKDTAAAV